MFESHINHKDFEWVDPRLGKSSFVLSLLEKDEETIISCEKDSLFRRAKRKKCKKEKKKTIAFSEEIGQTWNRGSNIEDINKVHKIVSLNKRKTNKN